MPRKGDLTVKDLPKMADMPSVRSVTGTLPSGELMGWGVIDPKQILNEEMMMSLMPMMLEMTEDFADMDERMPMMLDMAERNDMAKMLGPGWWYMKRTDLGMVFRAGVLESGD